MVSKKSTATPSRSDAVRAYLKAHPDASQKDIASGLAAQGVEASVSLINKIKYGKPKVKRSRKAKAGRPSAHRNGKPAARKAGASKAATGKAETHKAGTSKAQAIRDAFATLGRSTRPRDVIAHLDAQGVKVSAAQVSVLRKTKAKRKAAKAGSATRQATAGALELKLEHLIAAKKLTDQVGLQAARKALDILARLGA